MISFTRQWLEMPKTQWRKNEAINFHAIFVDEWNNNMYKFIQIHKLE